MRTIHNLPKPQIKQTATVKSVISLDKMMENLRSRIERQIKTSFFELRKNEPEHKNVIVGFLAILELFKQGNLIITQVTQFEDIEIELDQMITPRYF
jgi:chromatin segregation and condensation protein Rec8/ScpA/Scc1 (kleisin family)